MYVLFLTDSYRFQCFWWEPMECVRKLILIGVLLFYNQGTIAQLLVGLLVSMGSIMAYLGYKPFKEDVDNIMAVVCEVSIFGALVSSLVIAHSTSPLQEGDLEAVQGILIALVISPLVLVVPLSFIQLKKELGFKNPFLRIKSLFWKRTTQSEAVKAEKWSATGGDQGSSVSAVELASSSA